MLCHSLAACEEGTAGLCLLEKVAKHLAVALEVVRILQRHAGMLQEAHELLLHNGHPVSEHLGSRYQAMYA